MTELRRIPKQKRSEERLKVIEVAARMVYKKLGRDVFTTQDVAIAAGCSIGTVYNYFPDRVAIMDHIDPDRDKATKKLAAVSEILKNSAEKNPRAKIRAAVEVIDS